MRWPAHFVPTAPRDLVGEPVVELVVEPAPLAQDRPQVELLEREQAGAELALGGDADAVAAARRTVR